jgi:hypothetical protein
MLTVSPLAQHVLDVQLVIGVDVLKVADASLARR